MDNLKQTDIARSVAVSLSSLQKLFKHSLGYSINEYVMKRRMSEAATRLVLENAPVTIPFYEKCGFVRSHIIPNFFTDNYDHPIYEGGRQLVDMVYLQRRI